MTNRPKEFQIRDNRNRKCNKCDRRIVKGEWVRRSRNRNTAWDIDQPLTARNSKFLCSDCYTWPDGTKVFADKLEVAA